MSFEIPVYEAIAFEKEMVGGRNHPWLLTVQTDHGIEHYVAKIFSKKDIDQENALCKEIYASALAGEFGLPTPEVALITLHKDFRNTLSGDQDNILKHLHTRYAFGSKFISGHTTFSPAQHIPELSDYDIESVFAF